MKSALKKSSIVCVIALLSFFSVSAQSDFQKDVDETLKKIDKSSIPSGFLLNVAFTESDINDLNNRKVFSERIFRATYNSLINSDLSDVKIKNKLIADAESIRNRPYVNSIPISFINIEANMLTQAEIKTNIENKKNGKKNDGTKYKKIDILAGSVLQEDIYQGEITFVLDLDNSLIKSANNIKTLIIDFNDGSEIIKLPFKKGQEFVHKFTSVGEQIMNITFITNKSEYTSFVPLQIKSLTLPKFDKEIILSVPNQISESNVNGRLAAAFTTGKANITLGCDKVFDKPIIIVEGFDPTNTNTIVNWLSPHYAGTFQKMLNNGYDLVFLDFNDGTTWIQNNANVLIQLIQQVNLTKIGNNKSIVIGESMGGLVADMPLEKWRLMDKLIIVVIIFPLIPRIRVQMSPLVYKHFLMTFQTLICYMLWQVYFQVI